MSSLLRALRHRPFALLWSGQTISTVGDRIYQVTLAWWVLQETGSTVAMGTVLILTVAPMLVFLLLGGVMVDRLPRLRLMFVSDLVRGVVVSLTAWLAFADRLAIGHVYALSLVFGLVDAFFQPAYRAIVPEVVPAEGLPSANSLTSLSGQLSGIAGPALGAAVVAMGGTALGFGLDGLSFFISVCCLLPLLRLARVPQQQEASHGILGDLREGLATVAASPWLWITIVVAGISNIAYAGPMDVSLPFLIKDHFHADVAVLGLFYSASSVGSVLAALWLGRMARLRRRGLLVYGPWMAIGVLVLLMGLPIPVQGILVASFLIGACSTVIGLVWVNTLQELVPQHLLGRVTSVDYLGSYVLLPVGFAIGGWAARLLGPAPVFVIGGALQTVLVALGLVHPQVRSLD
jgi:DHA3 family tetracycline resistance protein-like MFS transporter